MKAFVIVIQRSGIGGQKKATCFPSIAHMELGNCQCLYISSEILSQSASVFGNAKYVAFKALTIAEQTLGTNWQIADFDIRNWNCKLVYDSPVAKYLNVQASFSLTGNGLRLKVDCFWRGGVTNSSK